MERQYVGIDLHRRRSVIVRIGEDGEELGTVRIENDPIALSLAVAEAGPNPEVALEACYGWYWAADVLQADGAVVHLVHPGGLNWDNRRVKNDKRDAMELANRLRRNDLPEAWIAPPEVRQFRELVRYRAKLVALRSGLKAQVHAVLAKEGVRVPMSDLFGVAGTRLLDQLHLGRAYAPRIASLRTLLVAYDQEVAMLGREVATALAGDVGYLAIQAIPGVGPVLAGRLRSRDRRRPPLRRRPPAVLLGRAHASSPRVRHHRAPRPHHQTGPPAGPLGRGRGGAAAPWRQQAGRRLPSHR